MIIKSKTTTYRVQCKAPWDAMPWGCSDLGPRGFSAQEAKELALVRDWENRNGLWICPWHLKAEAEHLRKQGFIVEGDKHENTKA